MILRPQDSFPKESWMEYADELDKQIAALKATCIEERAHLNHFSAGAINEMGYGNVLWENETPDTKKIFREIATAQLASEKQDIDWEERK